MTEIEVPPGRGRPVVTVARLMAAMIPITAYLGVAAQVRQFETPNLVVNPGPLLAELILLGTTGIAVAGYRRASFRDSIVQLTTTPVLLQGIIALVQINSRRGASAGGVILIILLAIGVLAPTLLAQNRCDRRKGSSGVWRAIMVGGLNLALVAVPFTCGSLFVLPLFWRHRGLP